MKSLFTKLTRAISYWYWNRRAHKAAETILRFDYWMKRHQYRRQQRRRFWKSFIANADVRSKIAENLKEEK